MRFAVAFGRVDPGHIGALAALDRLRVKFAHNLATKLNDQDELDVYNALAPKQREFVDSMRMSWQSFAGVLRTRSGQSPHFGQFGRFPYKVRSRP